MRRSGDAPIYGTKYQKVAQRLETDLNLFQWREKLNCCEVLFWRRGDELRKFVYFYLTDNFYTVI